MLIIELEDVLTNKLTNFFYSHSSEFAVPKMSFCFFPSQYKTKQVPDPPKATPRITTTKFFVPTFGDAPATQNKPTQQPKQKKRQPAKKDVCVFKKSLDMKESNVSDVDRAIKNNFVVEKQSLPSLREKLKNSDRIMFTSNQEKKEYVSSLRKKIKDIESSAGFLLYVFKTSDLLDEVKKIKASPSTKNFITTTSNHADPSKEFALTYKFIGIAQMYVKIEGIVQAPKKLCCRNCGSSNLRLSVEDESFYICRVCFAEREILDDTPSFKDTDRVNMTSKYTYTRRGHFNDAVKKFQGTQNTDPKKIQHVIDVLLSEIDKHNLCVEQNRVNSVSKDHIYTFLSEQDLSYHYDDVNLLFRSITGEPCPDLTSILDNLYEDFDRLEEALGRIKDENRSNSLTVNYKLYKLLQRWKYPCRKSDFYILKTKTKEDEHDEKMKEAFEDLGWEWIPTF